jgi:dTDP-4-dehydrorhamnose 3,5-epimerase
VICTVLSAVNGRMLYVPGRWAHGYQTLEGSTEMYYVTSAFYTPSAVRGIRFDDRAFSIQWPLVATLLSEQARSLGARRAAGVVEKARDRIGI